MSIYVIFMTIMISPFICNSLGIIIIALLWLSWL